MHAFLALTVDGAKFLDFILLLNFFSSELKGVVKVTCIYYVFKH